MRWYSLEPKHSGNWEMIYNRKHPPNSSVSETWTTRGLAHDGAQILFVEYEFYDLDPDGVRAAFDCLYESVHSVSLEVHPGNSEKLFMYTIEPDGRVMRGFDVDVEKARAVLVFTQPQHFSDDVLLSVTDKIEQAPTYDGAVNQILLQDLLDGNEEVVCLAYFKNRI